MRRSIGQVLLTGADDDFGVCAWPSQLPVTVEVTFGGLPAPCETVCVVRVHVPEPLLYETTLVLVTPAGALPNEATYGAAPPLAAG